MKNTVFILFQIVFLLVFSCCYGADTSESEKIIVCFRCDDIFHSFDSSNRNFLATKEIINTFQSYDIPITIGVTPNAYVTYKKNDDLPLLFGRKTEFKTNARVNDGFLTSDTSLAHFLREKKKNAKIEIALHGYTHRENYFTNESEFVGHSRDEQLYSISKAKSIIYDALGKIDLKTFVPPWNSFDLNTLAVLKEMNFSHISGELGRISGKPFSFRSEEQKMYYDILMVPATCSLKELPSALERAGEYDDGSIIVVTMHPYDFQEYGGNVSYNIDELKKTLENIKFDKRIDLQKISDLDNKIMDYQRFSSGAKYVLLYRMSEKIIPHRILSWFNFNSYGTGHWLVNGVYLSKHNYDILYNKLIIIMSVFFFLIAYLCGLCLYSIAKLTNKFKIFFIFIIIFIFSYFLFMENRYQIITEPNMCGVFITLLFFFTSIITVYLSLVYSRYKIKERNEKSNPAVMQL